MASQEVISEVIPLIEEAYFVKTDKFKNYGFTVTNLHKSLFKLKKELPNNEQIQEILPYYWYLYGPYSEVVAKAAERMESEGLLMREQNVLYLNRDKVTQEVPVDRDVRRGFNSALKHFNPTNATPFIERIYKEYSPYSFMPAFKIDFVNTIKEYISNLTLGQITLDDYSDTSVLRDSIFECETELPPHPLFDQFNTLFSSFTTDALRVFNYLREVDKDAILLNKVLRMAEDTVWTTFACGIRIVEHDPPYATRLKRWNPMYSDSLSELSSQVRAFRSDVLSTIRGTLRCEQDEKSQKFLSTVMQKTLSR
ncbi:MAG: hypothetical protein ABSB81_01170 [Halobacteriota archaeon]|jgi:hypothetical protein